MIDRRGAVRFALALSSAAWLFQSFAASAGASFERFLPFLPDLDGWQAKKADGLSMDMPGNSMTTATRAYQRGGAQIHVAIIVGPTAAAALAPVITGMNIQTSDGHVLSSTIAGLKAMKSYTVKNKSGAIIVALGDNALFSLDYNGVTEDEAAPLVEKFDLKGIQAAAAQK
jgi:hypothetical protein